MESDRLSTSVWTELRPCSVLRTIAPLSKNTTQSGDKQVNVCM